MQKTITRWFMFSLLCGWALTHATVFGQPAKTTTSPADRLRSALDKNITLDYTGQSLTDVLNHFRDKTGIAINVDQMALMQMGIGFDDGNPGGPMAQIQVKATNEKASQVLRRLLNGQQLAYIIFDDAVLVTTEEAGLMRQMRQRVNVDLEDVPFNKAVRTLAKNHGINLVIDPKVAKQAEANVSLQLDSTGIETAVRLMAELASLKAVRMGNVMFITSEEKADKIRKEEPNQIDNPFNPSMPTQPGIRFGIGGGFGGVMPMPARVAPPVRAVPPGVIPGAPGIDLPLQLDGPAPKIAPPNKGDSTPPPPPRPDPAPAVGRPDVPPALPQRPRD